MRSAQCAVPCLETFPARARYVPPCRTASTAVPACAWMGVDRVCVWCWWGAWAWAWREASSSGVCSANIGPTSIVWLWQIRMDSDGREVMKQIVRRRPASLAPDSFNGCVCGNREGVCAGIHDPRGLLALALTLALAPCGTCATADVAWLPLPRRPKTTGGWCAWTVGGA